MVLMVVVAWWSEMGLSGIASNYNIVTAMVFMATISTTWYCDGVDGSSNSGGLEWAH